MSRFTEAFTTALSEYCTHVLSLLELNDWRLTLLDEFPPAADAAAEILCVYGRRVAELKLQQDFFTYPPDDQRHYIVHELVHILTDGVDNVIENGVETLIGKPAYTVLSEAWTLQVEYLTDQLAYVLVNLCDGPTSRRLWKNVLRAEVGKAPVS